jgi:hypothetical protein
MKLLIKIILTVSLFMPAFYSQEKMSGSVFGIGGNDSANKLYKLRSTLGETLTGSVSNTVNRSKVGFWYLTKDVLTGIENDNNIPKVFSLSQNYPNPFNPSTTIEFQLPKRVYATLILYDIIGQEVVRILEKELDTGNYKIHFNAFNLSSGVYIYRLVAGDFISTKKLQLIK